MTDEPTFDARVKRRGIGQKWTHFDARNKGDDGRT